MNPVEIIATSWLHHQGYTDDQLAAAPKSHREAGCDREGWQWNCHNEFGESLHPVWDAICVAGAMANVAVEALTKARAAIVELPAQCIIPAGWHEDCLGAWPTRDTHPYLDPVSAWPKGEVALPDGDFMPAQKGRALALALLAAADAAEAVADV